MDGNFVRKSPEPMDEKAGVSAVRPVAPRTVEETGLSFTFITDLILKQVLQMGEFQLSDAEKNTRLPQAIVEEAIEFLRKEKLVEVRSAGGFLKSSYKFVITEQGKRLGGDLLEICRYTGPAPVTLESYKEMIGRQSIRNITVREAPFREAFSHLTLNEKILGRLGPAVSAGRPIFIYGPPGNGKTSIAEAIGRVLPDRILIPHALLVEGQIISVFDPVNHFPMQDDEGEKGDRRWLVIRRPVVFTGGELTLKMLELEFNPIARFYEAPLQIKANNGLFIVDDFGRQQMDPQDLLNRWIITLDREIDYLALHTGMKFDVPFDQLVLFCTNLEPKNLVDEAFLRRMRYKIKIDCPSEREFREIFEKECERKGVPFRADAFAYLTEHYYARLNVQHNACHPRDILDQILDDARFYDKPPEMTPANIDAAWTNYFVD